MRTDVALVDAVVDACNGTTGDDAADGYDPADDADGYDPTDDAAGGYDPACSTAYGNVCCVDGTAAAWNG